MRNELKTATEHTLICIDNGENSLFVNGVQIPQSEWSGVKTYGEVEITFSFADGNAMLQKRGTNAYELVNITSGGGGSIDDEVVSFTPSADRVNIQSGERIRTLFGKISKWFSDLKTVAFTGSYSDLSNKLEGNAPISVSGNKISLSNSGVTAQTYGPSANVTGSHNTTINIPQITVDAKGRITGAQNRVLTNQNTTYGAATASAAGLMSAGDKSKLDGILGTANRTNGNTTFVEFYIGGLVVVAGFCSVSNASFTTWNGARFFEVTLNLTGSKLVTPLSYSTSVYHPVQNGLYAASIYKQMQNKQIGVYLWTAATQPTSFTGYINFIVIGRT